MPPSQATKLEKSLAVCNTQNTVNLHNVISNYSTPSSPSLLVAFQIINVRKWLYNVEPQALAGGFGGTN